MSVAAATARRPRARVARKAGAFEFQLIVLVSLALVAFGLVMVYSATSAPAALGGSDPTTSLKRQGTYALLGLVALFVAARTDYRRLRALAPTLLVVAGLLCAFVAVAAPSVNGARRWIAVGSLTFQPSELAKVAVAIWVSAHLSRHRAPRTLKELARPIGLVACLFALLILAEPDLGTTIALMLMLFGILLVAGVPLPTLGGAASLAMLGGLVMLWTHAYQRARFFAFFHPFSNPQGAGYQLAQAWLGLGSGGIFGRGLGQGIQKIHYLPEANTDMIFAVIGEELGLVGVTLVVLAYAAFAYAGFRVALACRDPFGKRLAAGLTTLVCGQAVVNLAAVLGIAPLTGIPLPFISYGGTNLLLTLASVGVLLNIAVNGGKGQAAAVPDRSRGNSGTRRPSAGNRRSAAGARR
ncbi:MAG: cell division protein FtsW [Gaiellaceae bacterium]|nr:cell division protein FtsW [Gaiellaceae bacterium]